MRTLLCRSNHLRISESSTCGGSCAASTSLAPPTSHSCSYVYAAGNGPTPREHHTAKREVSPIFSNTRPLDAITRHPKRSPSQEHRANSCCEPQCELNCPRTLGAIPEFSLCSQCRLFSRCWLPTKTPQASLKNLSTSHSNDLRKPDVASQTTGSEMSGALCRT